MGGSGVHYPSKHVKHLRYFGYNPIVLTVSPEDYSGHSELRMPLDETRCEDIPGDIETHKVRSHQPFRLFRVLSKIRLEFLREIFFVPDSAITWILPAVRRGRLIAREKPIDLIYTHSRPNSTAIIGWILKKLLGKPWVLDFRDPWTNYFLQTHPTKMHFWAERHLEQFLIKRADHVIMVTPTALANLIAENECLTSERTACITMGYDKEDFDRTEATQKKGKDFTLLYPGVFCGAPSLNQCERGNLTERLWRKVRGRLSYRHRNFDRLTHSPKFLLDAMRELFAERPELRDRLKFLHIGPFSSENKRYAELMGLSQNVEFLGYHSHADAVKAMKQADALFICLADSPDGERNDCVPQKVYEYMGARKPILALVPEGDARDFLEKAGTAVICPPRDISAIKNALISLIEGDARIDPNDEFIRNFECRNITARLASVFDRLTRV